MTIEVRKPTETEAAAMKREPIWEKEVSTFPWSYDATEVCLLLEGKVTVTASDGRVATFGAGDFVVFPKGLSCTWEITEPVRKHYRFE